MLDKKLCYKCQKNSERNHMRFIAYFDTYFEKLWKNGVTRCPMVDNKEPIVNVFSLLSVNSKLRDIPPNCPCFLEYTLMLTQDSDRIHT